MNQRVTDALLFDDDCMSPQVEELIDINDEEPKANDHNYFRIRTKLDTVVSFNVEQKYDSMKPKIEFQPWSSSNEALMKEDFNQSTRTAYYVVKPKEFLKKKLNCGLNSLRSPFKKTFTNEFSSKNIISLGSDLIEAKPEKPLRNASFFRSQPTAAASPAQSNQVQASQSNLFRRSSKAKLRSESSPKLGSPGAQSKLAKAVTDAKAARQPSKREQTSKAAGVRVDLQPALEAIANIIGKKIADSKCAALNRNPYFLGKVRRIILDTGRESLQRSESLKKIETKRGIVIVPKKVAGDLRKDYANNILFQRKITVTSNRFKNNVPGISN